MTTIVPEAKLRGYRLLKTERVALVLLSLHLLLGYFWIPLLEATWVMALFPAGLLWLTTILFILPTFADARDEGSASRKARTLLSIPAVIIAVILLWYVAFIPQRLAASVYLLTHRAEMARAEKSAGERPAFGIHYAYGIPDGGFMIVRMKKGRPEQLTSKQVAELTGEGTLHCDPIISAWLCSFD